MSELKSLYISTSRLLLSSDFIPNLINYHPHLVDDAVSILDNTQQSQDIQQQQQQQQQIQQIQQQQQQPQQQQIQQQQIQQQQIQQQQQSQPQPQKQPPQLPVKKAYAGKKTEF
ncbi:hypothetical protein G6F62_012503 [Rhizopus arrhizus]|nr:hypothetical protein G6F62_012503 [Rhizopus arrhizus]KAG1366148.1 hypothetical protein G6F61_013278 [Rhizopus arrhizus]